MDRWPISPGLLDRSPNMAPSRRQYTRLMDVSGAPPIGAPPSLSDDWTDLVRQHNRAVVVSLLALRVPFEHAAELAQATWAKLIEKHRNGRLRELQLPGLAIAQARFLALDEMRRQGSAGKKFVSLDEVSGQPHPDSPPEDRIHSRRQLERMLDALEKLSPSAQRVFRLVYADARPHTQVADEVGLSLQRVRQTLCEIRAVLRHAVEQETT